MRLLIASLSLVLLAACGFQPMYAPTGGGAIGPVSIAEIEGKAGHVLRTELSRMLAVENDGSATPALLEVTLSESVTQQGLRLDESATRAELRLTANYVLTPGDGRSRHRGDIVAEIQALVAAGYQEAVLTGVHLGSYGRDPHSHLPRAAAPAPTATPVQRAGVGPWSPPHVRAHHPAR